MTVVNDIVTYTTQLQTATAPITTFGTGLFLVDDTQIPPDLRLTISTPTSYLTDYTSTTDPYLFAQRYFAQNLVPDQLMAGRWISSASKTYFVWGANYESDPTVYAAVTDASFRVIDSALNEDDITALNLSTVRSFADVLTLMTNAIQAIAVPNISGLDTSTFELDGTGRPILNMSTTGASAPTVTITAVTPASGTDISSATFLDAANGFAVAGIDAEEPTDALTAISDINDTWWMTATERSLSIAQEVAVSTYVEGRQKAFCLLVNDANAKASAATTDAGYLIKQLSNKRTLGIYHEDSAQWPDACEMGRLLPATEGGVRWNSRLLNSCTQSGYSGGTAIALTPTAQINLANKGYNYIGKIGDNIFMTSVQDSNGINRAGITFGGEEMRIIIGRDWFNAGMQADTLQDDLNVDLMAFDNATLGRLETTIRTWTTAAIGRGLGVDTPDRPLVINIPDADDFTASQRASHVLTLTNAFRMYLNSAINEYAISGTWTIG